jgi:hypothetical protein
MKTFAASLDNLSKIITGVLAPVFILMPWLIWSALRTQQKSQYESMLIGLAIILPLLFLLAYLMKPLSYTIDDEGSLSINAKLAGKKIALDQIKKAELVSKEQFGFLIRIMGNGGLFGYTGYFTAKDYGRMRWFVTNKDNTILLTLNNDTKVVVSPDDTAGFLKAIKK